MGPEDKISITDIVRYFQDGVSREDLQLLLTEDKAWQIFMKAAELSGDEAQSLRDALTEFMMDVDMDEEDVDMDEEDKAALQKHLRDRERFLKEFPQAKAELEECIAKLHALADKVDQVHRDCTISNVVATSAGAVSGILTIVGLALAPVTVGASLALTATGLGLGTAAAVTGVSTSIVEHATTVSAEAEAGCLTSTNIKNMEKVAEAVGQNVPKVIALTKSCVQVLQDIGKNVHAIKIAQTNSRLVTSAKSLMTTGKISARSSRQVQRAFGGTALAMSRGARVMGFATAGIGLLVDVVILVKESQHLHEGAKSKSAEELRQRAQELAEKLQELMEIHRSLQPGPIP
ncbi:apolipoprotein L3 [Lepus europaeus]|uniref:apolipoprotein L3 n=1 Tax=Lepus europaeus TaxID=9983 RepID=UPI002B47E2D8|nr:apolipoprotein L3 [Lepus europaeus]XP_062058889.1 apolipoprotein L3 [Lepus europaeus]XP_062058890.1 apolipoprotein L3 [Lepus europaeus]XP_062058891.1 apolipoprotein L3 [Lepus europaeus]XP_062058892.1 apolipoprotein L3 [Lepus europaeus]